MLAIRNLVKRFGELAVLDRIGLTVEPDEIVAVVGPSGCGKSTLLNIVAGLLRPDEGAAVFSGSRLGSVFQEDRLLPWRTVEENVCLVRDQPDPAGARRLLDLVGLAGFEAYYPEQLSGGMRQRCAIARAYHYRCDLLLMDEPFKSLDHGLRADMLDVLMRVRRERPAAVLFVTHELGEALAVASRLVALSARPARVLAEFSLGKTDAPRDVGSAEIAAIRREILALSR